MFYRGNMGEGQAFDILTRSENSPQLRGNDRIAPDELAPGRPNA